MPKDEFDGKDKAPKTLKILDVFFWVSFFVFYILLAAILGSAQPGAFLLEYLNPLFIFPIVCWFAIGFLPGLQLSRFDDMEGLDGAFASLMAKKGIHGNKLCTYLISVAAVCLIAVLIDDLVDIGRNFGDKNSLWNLTMAKIFVQPLLFLVAYIPSNIREGDAFGDGDEMYSKATNYIYQFFNRGAMIIYQLMMIIVEGIMEVQLRNNYDVSPYIGGQYTFPNIAFMCVMFMVWLVLHTIMVIMNFILKKTPPKLMVMACVSLELGVYNSIALLNTLQSLRINSRTQ